MPFDFVLFRDLVVFGFFFGVVYGRELADDGSEKRENRGRIAGDRLASLEIQLLHPAAAASRDLETMRRERPVQCRLGRAGWVSATKITPAGEYYGTLQ